MNGPGAPNGHYDEDFLLEVVHGLRADHEVANAVEHAHTCPQCDRQLRIAAADRERFRARAESVLAAPAIPVQSGGVRPAWARRRGLLGIALATAAAVAIVSSIVLLREPAPRAKPALLGLPAPLEIVHLRAREQTADLPRLEDAIARYGSGNWSAAARLLDTPFEDARLEPLRRLYLASALLELGRNDEARSVLTPIATKALPEPYADWREWARLRTSPEALDAGRADSVVRALAGRPGPLQGKAQALLEASTDPPAQGSQ